MANFQIELADHKNLNDILTLLDDGAKWLQSIGIKNQWYPGEVFESCRYYEKSMDLDYLYIIKKDKRIIGTFLLKWSDEYIWGNDISNAGYIHHFVINREFSGKSLGLYILKWIENKVIHEGKNFLRLDCIASNQKLNKYYQDKGYKLKKCILYEDGEAGNLYEKELFK